MRKLYTDEDYEQLAVQANEEGKKLVKIQEEQDFEIEVFEYKRKTVESPICDEEGNITGYETVEINDLSKPIIIEGVHKSHKETITDLAERLEIQDNPENFARMYFNTSLGYVSRVVHKLDGTTEDFLNDTLPSLAVGVPIITYNVDGSQNTNVLVTEEFITECRQQKLKDFYGEEPPQAEGT